MSHHQTEKTSRSKNAFGHRSLFCPVDLQAWLRGCAARQLVAELHERLEAERAILLVAQQEAAAHTRALIREDAATQLQSFWRSRKARRECEALRLKRWDQAPLRNQWPEVTVMLSPLQKAPLDNEDLEASSTSLPPDIASRRRVGEVRVGVPTCRQWNSRPMEYHELVAGTPRITREQESTTSVPRSRQTNLQAQRKQVTWKRLMRKSADKEKEQGGSLGSLMDPMLEPVVAPVVGAWPEEAPGVGRVCFEQFARGGLHRQPLQSLVSSIQALDFNCVRLPYSLEMHLDQPDVRPSAESVAANPQFLNMSVLKILNATIHALATARIMIILNNHQGKAMWCCSEEDGEGLWFSEDYSESDWLRSLQMLGRQYSQEPYVIGYDLRNEPRGIPAATARNLQLSTRGRYLWPQWINTSKTGTANWAAAALRAAVAVSQENEGLDFATDLRGVLTHAPLHRDPRLTNRLVYEVHDYCWYHVNFFHAWQLYWLAIGWFILAIFALRRKSKVGLPQDENLDTPGKLFLLSLTSTILSCWMTSYSWFHRKLHDRWGYLLDADEAPVWLGEFGTNGYWTTAVWSMEVGEVLWFRHLLRYVREYKLSYSYWALNGDKMGEDETFGLLDQDNGACTREKRQTTEIPGAKLVEYQVLVSGLFERLEDSRLNGPSRICDVGLQDGDIITAIVREPGPVMESYRKARAFAAILEDTVVTWGASDFGGDCESVRRQLSDVMQVHVSEFACAAIKNDGTVVSWGSALAGGDSYDVSHQLFDVREITATHSAFAAIKFDESVVAWGDPRNGGSCEEVQKDLFDVQKIFASNTAFAAIRADGHVVTWGAKNAGGGGDSSSTELMSVVQIHSTTRSFAALQADGKIVTWGASGRQLPPWQPLKVVQLGAPSTGGDSSRVHDELQDVVQVSASEGAFAAIRADGSAVVWGSAEAGGDATGHLEELLGQFEKQVQAELVNVHRIHAASGAFAAVRRDGRVVTWGDPRGLRVNTTSLVDTATVQLLVQMETSKDTADLWQSSRSAIAFLKTTVKEKVRAYPATTVPSGAQSAQVKRPPGPPKSKLLREVCTTKTQSTSSISSIWSPRSEYRRAPLISTPARGPEMSRAPRAVVASPTISGISTIGAPSQAPRQVRSQSQSSPYVTPFRQTRSFTPPGVMVPAWAWLPAPPVAVVKASPKEGMENLPQHALKVLPTPNRSRSLQRTPLRVIQVTRGSLNPNAGPPLRATLGPGAMPTIPWHPTVAAVRQTAWHVQSHSPEKP
eukprot:symbB.v1.2.003394.t2/scaffold190.1/size276550/19